MSGRPQTTTMNGKRTMPMPTGRNPPQQQQQQQQQLQQQQSDATSQHFDLIKYIQESWTSVTRELDNSNNQHGNSSGYRNGATVTYYKEQEPNPKLKNFEPFDLEAFCSKRAVQNIARNANS